jgi:hypothetical protein
MFHLSIRAPEIRGNATIFRESDQFRLTLDLQTECPQMLGEDTLRFALRKKQDKGKASRNVFKRHGGDGSSVTKELRLWDLAAAIHAFPGDAIAVKLLQGTRLNTQSLRPLGGVIRLIDQSNVETKSPELDGKCEPGGPSTYDQAIIAHEDFRLAQTVISGSLSQSSNSPKRLDVRHGNHRAVK